MPQHSNDPFHRATHITPIACPRCGGKAGLIRRSPDPQKPNVEVRTFECEACSEQTEMRAA